MDTAFVVLSSALYCVISAVVMSRMMKKQIKTYFELHLKTHLTELGVVFTEQTIAVVENKLEAI